MFKFSRLIFFFVFIIIENLGRPVFGRWLLPLIILYFICIAPLFFSWIWFICLNTCLRDIEMGELYLMILVIAMILIWGCTMLHLHIWFTFNLSFSKQLCKLTIVIPNLQPWMAGVVRSLAQRCTGKWWVCNENTRLWLRTAFT